MGAHKVDLKFANLISCDTDIGQFAYTGGDRVRDAIFRDQSVDDRAGAIDGVAGLPMKQDGATVARDVAHRFEGEIFSIDV
jgi:hypothetical protein